jgi:hypothetical protein
MDVQLYKLMNDLEKSGYIRPCLVVMVEISLWF